MLCQYIWDIFKDFFSVRLGKPHFHCGCILPTGIMIWTNLYLHNIKMPSHKFKLFLLNNFQVEYFSMFSPFIPMVMFYGLHDTSNYSNSQLWTMPSFRLYIHYTLQKTSKKISSVFASDVYMIHTCRSTYQNIWPEMTGKPWSVISLNAKGDIHVT